MDDARIFTLSDGREVRIHLDKMPWREWMTLAQGIELGDERSLNRHGTLFAKLLDLPQEEADSISAIDHRAILGRAQELYLSPVDEDPK